jgi:hypothetical protein
VAGLRPTDATLMTRKHVMALPPGENGWIQWLDTYFDRQRGEIEALLQREAARPWPRA